MNDSLDGESTPKDPSISLSWAAPIKGCHYANFGDALSPVVLKFLTGMKINHVHFDSNFADRIVGLGSILLEQKTEAYIWGTGIGGELPSVTPSTFPNHKFLAIRGPITLFYAKKYWDLDEKKLAIGDPSIVLKDWLVSNFDQSSNGLTTFLPHLSDLRTEKIGVLEPRDLKLGNAHLLPADADYFISPFITPTWEDLSKKIQDIVSARYLITSSFHGYCIRRILGLPVIFVRSYQVPNSVLAKSRFNSDLRAYEFELGFGHNSTPQFLQIGSGTIWRSRNYFKPNKISEKKLNRSKELLESCLPLVKNYNFDLELSVEEIAPYG